MLKLRPRAAVSLIWNASNALPAATCAPKTFLISGFPLSTHAIVILLERGVEASDGSLEVDLIDDAHDDEND